MRRGGRNGLALLAALAIHGGAAAALVSVKPETSGPDRVVLTEFEMEEPPPPPPEPEPTPEPEPDKVEPARPEPELHRPEPRPEKPEPPEPRPTPPPEPAPPAAGQSGDPAPGWATEPPNADQPYDLGSAVPAAQARAPAARGRGGTGGGAGTGGGGDGDASVPVPVSVADIKTMPQPIGDTDFVEAHKEYPADARRLGVEGQVKVRLIVDAQGGVASRRLVTRLGHGLDQLAMRLSQRLHFRPALDTSDRPVPAVVVWTFTFTLPK